MNSPGSPTEDFVEANLWKLTAPVRRLPATAVEQLQRITEDGPFSLVHIAASAELEQAGHPTEGAPLTFGWTAEKPRSLSCAGAEGLPADIPLTPALLQALTTEVDSWLYRNVADSRILGAPTAAPVLIPDSLYAADLRASLMGEGPQTPRRRRAG
jgi:hypothetical protein